MSAERRSMVWMAALAAVWVIVEELARFLDQPYSAYQIVWTRYCVHLLFLLAVWGWRDPRALWQTRRPAAQVLRPVLMAAMEVALILAMEGGVDYGAIWTVFWVTPFLIPLFASMWLGERASFGVWLACGTAVAGASLLHGPVLPRTAATLFLPLLAAASFSSYVVMARVLRREPIRTNLFYTVVGVFAALTLIVPRFWVPPTPHDLIVFAAMGLIGLGALYAIDRMASAAAVSSSAPFIALQVAFTIGASAILTDRILGVRAWGGACLIGGAALWSWARRNPIAVTSTP